MSHFFDHNPESLATYCEMHGMAPFVSRQLLDWVYAKGVIDPQAMTNLSPRNRSIVSQTLLFHTGRVLQHQMATDGTQKLLVDWSHAVIEPEMAPGQEHAASNVQKSEDDSVCEPQIANFYSTSLPQLVSDPNKQTECVMIPTELRKTACISSQIGCPVGCKFCASGIGGLDGNLRTGQIVEQVHCLGQLEEVDRITNIVFMGMGEPLANFTNVTNAIRTFNAPWGFGISARKVTISTVGLPAAIRKLVNFEIPVTLALSLHAPNDDIRRQLIPWANYATIEELLDACDDYFQKTGREITLEYLLMRGVNDRIEHAKELAHLAKRLRANVNLIRYNEVKGLPFDRPTTEDVLAFQNVLRNNHVNVHVRASRGRDIAAACGQLRHEHRETTKR